MTDSTAPPDTAHETTDDLREIARLLADLYVETCSVAGRAEGQVQCDAQEVRDEVARIQFRLTSLLDDVADAVETVQYRTVGTGPSGRTYQPEWGVNGYGAAADQARQWQRSGFSDVRIESRRTWVSGWRPVDTGGAP